MFKFNNIMKCKEYETYTLYRIGCSCSDPDCDMSMTFEISKDKDCQTDFEWTFFKNMRFHDNNNIFNKIWNRIKNALKILCIGHIAVEDGLVINDPKHIDGIIYALQECKNKIEACDNTN